MNICRSLLDLVFMHVKVPCYVGGQKTLFVDFVYSYDMKSANLEMHNDFIAMCGKSEFFGNIIRILGCTKLLNRNHSYRLIVDSIYSYDEMSSGEESISYLYSIHADTNEIKGSV